MFENELFVRFRKKKKKKKKKIITQEKKFSYLDETNEPQIIKISNKNFSLLKYLYAENFFVVSSHN